MSAALIVASKTDPGKRRAENQDAILVLPLEDAEDEAVHILAVADGVGGGPGGRLASEQAVRSLSEARFEQGNGDPSEGLRKAFRDANESVMEIAKYQPDLVGMASTLTAALVRQSKAWLANVGDSRVYLVRGKSAWPMTYDHSWVAEQVEAGNMTADQAATDPRRNMITRAIGVEAGVEPDLYEAVELQDGDVLVLCSDGLYGVVEDDEIANITTDAQPSDAVEQLVGLANARGGPDNISVVVALWTTNDEATIDLNKTVQVPQVQD